MRAYGYIVDSIGDMVEKFPLVRLVYNFDNLDQMNTIEVTPSYYLKSDDDFIVYTIKMLDEFNKLYPDEDIFFLPGKDHFIELDNILHVGYGKDYIKDPNDKIDMGKNVRPHGEHCGCPLTYSYSPALGCPNPTYVLKVTGRVGIGDGGSPPTEIDVYGKYGKGIDGIKIQK